MRISDWSSDVCSSDLYRAELLRRLHLDFIGEASEIDETPQPGEDVASLVRRLALAKARALRDRPPDGWIPGSDQRSEERRVGNESASTCESRWSPDH